MGCCLSRVTSVSRHCQLADQVLVHRKYIKTETASAITALDAEHLVVDLGVGGASLLVTAGGHITVLSAPDEFLAVQGALGAETRITKLVKMRSGNIFAACVARRDLPTEPPSCEWLRVHLLEEGASEISEISVHDDRMAFFSDYIICIVGDELVFFNLAQNLETHRQPLGFESAVVTNFQVRGDMICCHCKLPIGLLTTGLLFKHQDNELNLSEMVSLIEQGDPASVTVMFGYQEDLFTKKTKDALVAAAHGDPHVEAVSEHGTALVYNKEPGEKIVVFMYLDEVFVISGTAAAESRSVSVYKRT